MRPVHHSLPRGPKSVAQSAKAGAGPTPLPAPAQRPELQRAESEPAKTAQVVSIESFRKK